MFNGRNKTHFSFPPWTIFFFLFPILYLLTFLLLLFTFTFTLTKYFFTYRLFLMHSLLNLFLPSFIPFFIYICLHFYINEIFLHVSSFLYIPYYIFLSSKYKSSIESVLLFHLSVPSASLLLTILFSKRI